MSELYEVVERPDLERPCLVLAVDGWIDAGFGMANARKTLLDSLETVTVAVFDSDTLLDHRSRRPTMHLVEGTLTSLTWPSTELRAASDPDGNDLLILVGAEPDHFWPSFTRAVTDLALGFDVRLAVGLGAYPAAAPHTRATRLAVAASSKELAHAHSDILATIDAPAGIQAAIERRLADLGVPTLGLWAQVPHYISATPYPAASAALIDGLARAGDLVLESGELHREAARLQERLDALVASNAEHVAMVRQLEEQWDAVPTTGGGTAPFGRGPLPSGDELAAELERFLRDQDD